ncbi:MAG: OmpA family protein [Candidatus Binatia bacterium]
MVKSNKKATFPFVVTLSMLTVSSVGVGCSVTNNPALDHARASYEQAQQDAQVNANASVALYEAQIALRRAEKAWKTNQDQEEVGHLSYLTEQRVKIARATAQQTMAETEMQQLAIERERVILEARSREAEQARQDREVRAREADQARRQAVKARSQARKLEKRLANLKAMQTERGLVINFSNVLFDPGSTDLKPGAIRNAYPLVDFLKEYPKRQIAVEGHTDSMGSALYNLDLSQRRADSFRNFLIQNGIGSERITARGYGEAYPITSNKTAAGRQQNRRVEIVISREGESYPPRKNTSN